MIYTVTLNPALDKTYTIPSFVARKVNRVLSVRTDPGGKGINVSKTVQVLGGVSVAMGIAGGRTGEQLRIELDRLGIAHDFVLSDTETRTNIKINDPETGTTTDINESGQIRASDSSALLEKVLMRLQPGDIAVIAGRIDPVQCDVDSWICAIRQQGARVCLDTEGQALKVGVQCSPVLIKPNEAEFADLIGKGTDDLFQTAAEACAACERWGIEHVIVSLGERGALFAAADQAFYAPPVPLVPVSTVGAGDAMCAGLIYSLDQGMERLDMYRLSVACASAAVCCPGTQSPQKEHIKEMLQKTEISRIL